MSARSGHNKGAIYHNHTLKGVASLKKRMVPCDNIPETLILTRMGPQN